MSTARELITKLESIEASLDTLSRRLDGSIPGFDRALTEAEHVLGGSNTGADLDVIASLHTARNSIRRAEDSIHQASRTISDYLRNQV